MRQEPLGRGRRAFPHEVDGVSRQISRVHTIHANAAAQCRGRVAAGNRKLERLIVRGQRFLIRPVESVVHNNAAAALTIAGKVTALLDGAELAAAALDDGRARAVLQKLVEISQGQPH